MDEHIVEDVNRQNWIIAIVSIAVFMFSIDYSMVNISLPNIAKYFSANLNNVSRVPLAYLLVVTSTALLFGKLADISGFKKIFVAGLAVFLTGTLFCSIAPTLNILLALRVYQCIGEAMFSPIGIAIATLFLPSKVKGKALGIMATAQGVGFCLGPIVGGYLNEHFGWHSIFLVNVPIGIITIAAAMKMIPSKQPMPEDKRIDTLGAALVFISLSTLIFALNSLANMGLKNPVIISSLALSGIAMALFIMQEARSKNPILHLPLFLNRDFTFATLSAFCIIFLYMGLIFLFPFYLTMVMHINIMEAGLVLMLPALMVIIFAPISGLLSDRFGSRIICVAGIMITAAAFSLFSLFTPKTPLINIAPSLILAGIAIGFFLPANNKLIMILAPSDKQGMASAVYKIINSTGGVFGIAVLPLIIMKKVSAGAALMHIEMSAVKLHPDILITGFNAAFRFCVFICLTSLIFAILARDKKGQ